MGFFYDEKLLSANPCVRKVDRYRLSLTTEFRLKLYKLWREDKITEIDSELEKNGLGPGATGNGYMNSLILSFKNSGYPVYKRTECLRNPSGNDDNPLLKSGLFEMGDHNVGIRIKPAFEQELFMQYPEVSVEEGIRLAGLDPVDVGYQRIKKIEKELEQRACRAHVQSMQGNGPVPEKEKASETFIQGDAGYKELIRHPYVRDIRDAGIMLSDRFYDEAYLLADVDIERLLKAYELPAAHFEMKRRMAIHAKLLHWDGAGCVMEKGSPQQIRIWRGRITLMEERVSENFRALRSKMPDIGIAGRRRVALWVDSLPRDPRGVYTTGQILKEVGLAKSTYYELLHNEDYGKSVQRRQMRDDVDILLVKQVAEYKGYAKGYRQISMMMEPVTGQVMSEHRVLYLMRKYGIRTSIRRPSRNRKAMKELMKRNGKENLLMRRFKLHRPNEVRLTDVTYLDYGDGMRAYGSASIDPVTNRLVCFVVSEDNDLQLALDTLEAMDMYPAVNGGIIHSDQGILYFTDDFQAAVADRNLIQSMSRRGNCWDNAPQESFFGHFKDESGYRGCKTLDELREKVQDYSVYYNEERRIHSRGKMTPAEYEAYLCAMDEDAFAAYMAAEEEKYLKKKEEAAAKATDRARERREAIEARLEEVANETGR